MTSYPKWLSSSSLAPIVQGTTVSIALSATEMVDVDGYAGNNQLFIGSRASSATTVTINGQAIAFTISSDHLVLSTTFQTNFTAKVTLGSSALTFSFLNGSLPLGLVFDASGTINGKVGTIPSETQTFTFTVRVSNGNSVRDRQFSIVASGTQENGTILTDGLPSQSFFPSINLRAYDFGTYDLSSAFLFKIPVTNPFEIVEEISVITVPDIVFSDTVFDGLPLGVTVSGTTIRGIVGSDAAPGLYVFVLQLSNSNSFIYCAATVTSNISAKVAIIPSITWVTPTGLLGTLNEGEPSSFTIKAIVTGVSSFKYALSPNSDPLPQGLSLDSDTGKISGTALHMPYDTSFVFKVRITIGNYFDERNFEIRIHNLYNTVNALTIHLKPFTIDAFRLLKNYETIITSNYLYRPNDLNFGLTKTALVYLVGDIDPTLGINTALDGNNQPFIYRPDFHAPVNLILSEHKSAVVRDDKGTIVYEVIYRELIDPLQGAGGFTIIDNVPVRTDTIWPESGSTKRSFYPSSLENIRYDLITDLGFPVVNSAMRHNLSSENMPEWMVPLGYVPCIKIACVLPGYAEAVLTRLAQQSDKLLTNGYVCSFDRYHGSEHVETSPTAFEDGTSFDDATDFDRSSSSQGKYYEPIIGNTK